MGGHTGPTEEGAAYAPPAQERAKSGREAQQRQLAAKTGDVLYPASGLARCTISSILHHVLEQLQMCSSCIPG